MSKMSATCLLTKLLALHRILRGIVDAAQIKSVSVREITKQLTQKMKMSKLPDFTTVFSHLEHRKLHKNVQIIYILRWV